MEGQSSKALVWDARKTERKDKREKMFVEGWNSWKELGVKGRTWLAQNIPTKGLHMFHLPTCATSTPVSFTGKPQRACSSPAHRQ